MVLKCGRQIVIYNLSDLSIIHLSYASLQLEQVQTLHNFLTITKYFYKIQSFTKIRLDEKSKLKDPHTA